MCESLFSQEEIFDFLLSKEILSYIDKKEINGYDTLIEMCFDHADAFYYKNKIDRLLSSHQDILIEESKESVYESRNGSVANQRDRSRHKFFGQYRPQADEDVHDLKFEFIKMKPD